jgi:hypothetical protein
MLGPPTSRRLDEPITVSLKDLVPVDHFCRNLEATRNLRLGRDWAQGFYADRGRVW